jgi:hypothetical protein
VNACQVSLVANHTEALLYQKFGRAMAIIQTTRPYQNFVHAKKISRICCGLNQTGLKLGEADIAAYPFM